MEKIKKIIVTGLGTGYLPIAPGTWASGAVAVVFLLIAWCSDADVYCLTGSMVALAVLWSVACLSLGRFAEEQFGRKDPSECTADEWAGQAIAYILLPMGSGWREWIIAAAVGFVAFRVFDIVKPPPARKIQDLHAGRGILADDLIAGVYANILSQVILRLFLTG